MKLAFLYGGQGSQVAGMGKDLYESLPYVKAYYDGLTLGSQPGDALYDLQKLSFEADLDTLSKTKHTQPVMVAFSGAVTTALKEAGIVPEAVCGSSIGEYAALAAAGALTWEQAVQIAAIRGASMQKDSEGMRSGMIAILGSDEETIARICEAVTEEFASENSHSEKSLSQESSSVSSNPKANGAAKLFPTAQISNLNCPGQIVVAGENQAVERVAEKAKEAGAKRIVPLNVSGPFHTTYMAPTSVVLENLFATTVFRPQEIPVYFNRTGTTLSNEAMVPAMIEQVKKPVLLEKALRTMIEDGFDTFVEIGFGDVIKGFLKRIDRSVTVIAVNDTKTLEEAVTALRELRDLNKGATHD